MESAASLRATEEGCDWVRCKAPFAAAYNDVEVIPEGSTMRVRVGRVALCQEHMKIFTREMRVQLDWERIIKGEL